MDFKLNCRAENREEDFIKVSETLHELRVLRLRLALDLNDHAQVALMIEDRMGHELLCSVGFQSGIVLLKMRVRTFVFELVDGINEPVIDLLTL